MMGAEYKGEEGVFTVHAIAPEDTKEVPKGAAWTDDITSKLTTHRCAIPAHIINECTLVSEADG
jgi:hypothetical protein